MTTLIHVNHCRCEANSRYASSVSWFTRVSLFTEVIYPSLLFFPFTTLILQNITPTCIRAHASFSRSSERQRPFNSHGHFNSRARANILTFEYYLARLPHRRNWLACGNVKEVELTTPDNSARYSRLALAGYLRGNYSDDRRLSCRDSCGICKRSLLPQCPFSLSVLIASDKNYKSHSRTYVTLIDS